jgi:hypothetical protein
MTTSRRKTIGRPIAAGRRAAADRNRHPSASASQPSAQNSEGKEDSEDAWAGRARWPHVPARWLAALFLGASVLAGCGISGGDDTPPSPPSGLSADSEAGASVLQWSEPEAEDLEGYNVYRSPDTPVEVENSTPLTDGLITGPPFTDEGAENGTTYRYRVTAVDDSDNESAPSDSARVTPFADPPSRPSSQP